MISYYLSVIIVITTSFVCSMCHPANDHDESCGTGTSLGLCKKLSECPSGLEQVKRQRFHSLQRCGFTQEEEIVCCPDFENVKLPGTVVSRVSNVDRESVAACKRYISSYKPGVRFYITEGEDAVLGEFPHMAQIGYEDPDLPEGMYTWSCGGSLISNRFVLTAAHCILRRAGSPSRVRLGFIDTTLPNGPEAREFGVKNSIPHPDFNHTTVQNDIGLLELDSIVQEDSYIYPACLYQESDNPSDLLITGWGNTVTRADNPVYSRILQKAKIQPIELSECSRLFRGLSKVNIISSHICCLSTNSSIDACQGDSGGPLQKQISVTSGVYKIIGVISYGQGCGGVTPGVYTRVSKYLDWIENIVWSPNNK